MRALERIADLLRAAHLEESLTAPAAIERIVAERRRATGSPSDDAYADLASRSGEEFARLREQIAVPETWLFRYPEAFELLRQRLVARHGAAFRALSVACATGAEPFSVAATALAAGIPADRIEVLAIDPNRDALERARRADLGRMALRGGIPPWAARLVDGRPGGAHVEPEVRSCVTFREGAAPDALADLPAGTFDAVFCRNLAIYLGKEGRRAIGERLHALLAPDGVLFLGHAERPSHFGLEDRLAPADPSAPGAFAFVRAGRAATGPMPGPAPARKPSARKAVPRTPAAAPAANPRGTTVDAVRAAADAGDLAGALRSAESLHADGDRSLELLELIAALHLGLGDHVRAEDALRQVAYLDPGNAEALIHLAELADRRGDPGLARRYRARAAGGAP